MPSLGTFLTGYETARQGNLQADSTNIQQAGALQKLFAQQQAVQQERELQQVVAQAGGDPERAMKALLASGRPQAIELAAKLKGLMPKHAEPQSIGSGGLRLPDGTIVPPQLRPEQPKPQSIGSGGLRLPDGTVVPPAARPDSPESNKPMTDFGRLNADLKAGRITKEQYDAATRRIGTSSDKASDDVVNAIAQGRMQMPTGFALRSPYWQDVIERVAKVNPSFDAGVYGARASARRTFASGPEARNVTAMNTLIGHLGTLDEAMLALENKDVRLYNAAQNRLRKELGDDRIANFDTAKKAVASEAMRVFRQVGASTQEMQDWEAAITSAGSPAQMRGTIRTLGELLEKRIEAIGQQYERTVTGTGNPAGVDPKNRTLLDTLRAPAGAPKEGDTGKSKSGKPTVFRNGRWEYQ